MNWADWRREFPILSRTTYLNSCSLGALGRRGAARVASFQDEWSTYGASAWYETWMGRLAELRHRVATMLSGDAAQLALVPSTSVALAAFASALDYSTRSRVVVGELDFPTLAYAWMARSDVEVVRVPSDDGVTIDPARFADAVDSHTAVVASSHVYFTTGAIQHLPALAEIAHGRGALFVVDAYQSVGQIPVDAPATGADILTTGPLKWLLGGPGLAYLWLRPELAGTLEPTLGGWFGARDQFAFDITRFEPKVDARRFEMGTPSLPSAHFALGGQDVIDEIGVPAIRQRNRALTERLIEALRAAGFRLRCATEAERRSAIVMVEDPDPTATVAHLAARGIIVDARPGLVRISPHFYNTEDEVDLVAHELTMWRRA